MPFLKSLKFIIVKIFYYKELNEAYIKHDTIDTFCPSALFSEVPDLFTISVNTSFSFPT